MQRSMTCFMAIVLKRGIELKFVYYNDTGRNISIHAGTESSGIICDMGIIKPLEARVFTLPSQTYPWVKMWDHGGNNGLCILVSAQKDEVSPNN